MRTSEQFVGSNSSYLFCREVSVQFSIHVYTCYARRTVYRKGEVVPTVVVELTINSHDITIMTESDIASFVKSNAEEFRWILALIGYSIAIGKNGLVSGICICIEPELQCEVHV